MLKELVFKPEWIVRKLFYLFIYFLHLIPSIYRMDLDGKPGMLPQQYKSLILFLVLLCTTLTSHLHDIHDQRFYYSQWNA